VVKRALRQLGILLVLSVLAGCVAKHDAKPVKLETGVVTTLPNDVARRYLRNAATTDAHARTCKYSRQGVTGYKGRMTRALDEMRPYADWRVSFVGSLEYGVGKAVVVVLRARDSKGSGFDADGSEGRECFAYYRRDVAMNASYEQEMKKVVSALASLGVHYAP
jgi:hypothetical protein